MVFRSYFLYLRMLTVMLQNVCRKGDSTLMGTPCYSSFFTISNGFPKTAPLIIVPRDNCYPHNCSPTIILVQLISGQFWDFSSSEYWLPLFLAFPSLYNFILIRKFDSVFVELWLLWLNKVTYFVNSYHCHH